MAGKVRKFQTARGMERGGTYVCVECGKRTRETGDGESAAGMCAACYADNLTLNEESDNAETPDARRAAEKRYDAKIMARQRETGKWKLPVVAAQNQRGE